MDALQQFISYLTISQKKLFTSLNNPSSIQEYLDSIPYRVEDDNFCALSVFRDGKAHCFDGSLFAAAALRQIGFDPMIVQTLPEKDDDHMLAIYKLNGRFGALAKSNFVGLRCREPVFASVRELVMSYFKDFYNLDGIFSLRAYTLPINLKKFDQYNWMASDEGAQSIVKRLHDIKKIRLLTPQMIVDLAPVDTITYKAGFAITNMDGVFKPGTSPDKDFGL